jgi:hypothetical protein
MTSTQQALNAHQQCNGRELTIDLENIGVWSGGVKGSNCSWQHCLATNLNKLEGCQKAATAAGVQQGLQYYDRWQLLQCSQ